MKIKNPKTGKHANIYSARLTFVREKNGQVRNTVYVTIHHNKSKKNQKNLPVPEEIDTNELDWRKKNNLAVYYRSENGENYDYTSKGGGIMVPTGLCQKLEQLVLKAYFNNF